jgi:hypothetical protein
MAKWAIFGGIFALMVALLWAGPYSNSRHGTGVLPLVHPPVGTSGRNRAGEPEDSPATLHDLETVTGAVDPHELIGRRVDFSVKVANINNYTSFWVGTKDNRMLVVLERNKRSDAQRDRGAPSSNDIKPAAAGQMVRITGDIEQIPDAEARFSWGLDDSQRGALQDQKVYIRADHVMPEG